ncbi:stimulus-sensing domain-containing protein [Limobrevibacterium gyesilva]|uniref:histidine kinase n=1 Tax=Limobrevibacterium gyesilva TaxID=2991712 RepID=A0AA41YNP0_9PROT|nr:stimulus-sensing domain-containing protein [Limobrevibacterium gyesilva]MCW3473665.1 stimulus-sensing domain-containing protein [Limobrevibacterium gyesilva]
MPDSGVLTAGLQPTAVSAEARIRPRWVSPLLRRILLVNALPLALLLAALLYLDQYQNGLLQAEVTTLREQARIYAGALGEAAVREDDPDNPKLVPDQARPLLRRLTEPTPNAQARLYAPDGQIVADSRVREGAGGAVATEPLPPAVDRGFLLGTIGRIYDRILSFLPHGGEVPLLDTGPSAAGLDWQPDVREELRLTGSNQSREMPPYIRRTQENRLLVTVAEPVLRNRHSVGIVLLTREAREVDDSLLAVRLSILALFTLALGLTVMLSWYLSLTIARPILRLAGAAAGMREGSGRSGEMPEGLLARRDEIGELAHALSESARALWARMDAIERFAADVAHEIKNPLSSIRSAIETLRRIEDPEKQRRLLAIIAEDVGRLDRLISDISDASRIDAELSRVATERVDVAPILSTLAEINEATRGESGPHVELAAPDGRLVVQGVEDRLVQVLRNLIGNAQSFSPPNGRISLRARETGNVVELSVEDEGPGIPESKLEHIFDRFYSERPQGERFGQHSGLGLSISRQIVEALKGRISAENRRDERGRVIGARFVVRLPKG